MSSKEIPVQIASIYDPCDCAVVTFGSTEPFLEYPERTTLLKRTVSSCKEGENNNKQNRVEGKGQPSKSERIADQVWSTTDLKEDGSLDAHVL